MRGGTGRGRRALEVFTGTVCVTVTSQAPLWFRIRPQELGDKDKNGRCGTCCRPLNLLHILQMRNTSGGSRAPEILLLGVRTSHFESRQSSSNLKLGKKWYFRFSIFSTFILHLVMRSHIWSKWHSEIDPKSDPKSIGFVSISKTERSDK